MPIQVIRFDGEDAFENFSEWTNDVNLQRGEIKKITIEYFKKR